MENLRFHVCSKIVDHLYNAALRELPKKKNKINFHITSYIEFSQTNPNLWLFLYSHNTSSKKKAPSWFLEKLDRLFALYTEAFYPYTKTKKAAVKAAHVILASMHGMCVLAINSRPDGMNSADPVSMAKHLVKIYLRGLNNA